MGAWSSGAALFYPPHPTLFGVPNALPPSIFISQPKPLLHGHLYSSHYPRFLLRSNKVEVRIPHHEKNQRVTNTYQYHNFRDQMRESLEKSLTKKKSSSCNEKKALYQCFAFPISLRVENPFLSTSKWRKAASLPDGPSRCGKKISKTSPLAVERNGNGISCFSLYKTETEFPCLAQRGLKENEFIEHIWKKIQCRFCMRFVTSNFEALWVRSL